MDHVLKQVLGVDVDQQNLVTTLGRLTNDLSVELYAHKVFPNHQNGFKSLLCGFFLMVGLRIVPKGYI